jgi:phosphoglycolate phosphatase
MPIRAVLLDKDGTLLDVEASWGRATVAVIRALTNGEEHQARRLAEIAMVDEATGRFHPESPIIAGSAADFGPSWAAVLERVSGPAFFAEIDALYRALGRASLTPLPGAADAVRRLYARGVPIGLATNDAEANARDHLETLGIAACFGFVAGYDTGHGAKPGPGMVLAFAAHAGCDVAEVALVGDSLHDMIAARSAGAVAVAVTTGMASADALAPVAHIVAPDIAVALDRLGV